MKSIDLSRSSRKVNIILKLVSGYLDRWDERTYRRYRLYSQYGTIYRVAELEKVTPEAINKYLNRLGIREVLESVRSIDETISEGSFVENPDVLYQGRNISTSSG